MTNAIDYSIKTNTLQELIEKGIPKIEWRVDNLVPKRGIVIFGGTSGSYKTWTAMHLALSCALGRNFLYQFKTDLCNVLYIDAENGDITLPFRFQELIKGHQYSERLENVHLSIFPNFQLDNALCVSQLRKVIMGYKIKLIVIDSMVRCMSGQEDKATDVRRVFENLKSFFKEFSELAIVILHHTTKTGAGINALRGSGDFAAFADVVLMFNKKGRSVTIEIAKNRHIDVNELPEFHFVIDNPQQGGIILTYLASGIENISAVSLCKQDILAYFKEHEVETFHNSNLRSEMEKKSHRNNTFYDTVNELLQDGKIRKIKRGQYRVLFMEQQINEAK